MTVSIGKALPRKEDLRLLTGGGSYSDDVHLPGLAYAIVVRSPHAHARIRAIDDASGARDARRAGGADRQPTRSPTGSSRSRTIRRRPARPPTSRSTNRDGSAHGRAPHPILPTDRVRFVGEAVALVVAETLPAAKDAAERVQIDYEPLPPVTAAVAAAQAGAPQLYEQVANICIDARRRRCRRDRGGVRARRARGRVWTPGSSA